MTTLPDLQARVIAGMADADYRALARASKSESDRVRRAAVLRHHPVETTDAMHFGSALHAAVLEPLRFEREYQVIQAANKNAKAWKDAKAEHGPERLLLTHEHDTIAAMVAALPRWQPAVTELLDEASHTEAVVLWTDPEIGVACKCRIDAVVSLADGSAILIDIKTTQDASPAGFAKSIANYRYGVQAAFYADGWTAATGQPARFVFLAIEKAEPHLAAAYELSAGDLAKFRSGYKRDLAAWKVAEHTDFRAGYAEGIQTATLPAWAFN